MSLSQLLHRQAPYRELSQSHLESSNSMPSSSVASKMALESLQESFQKMQNGSAAQVIIHSIMSIQQPEFGKMHECYTAVFGLQQRMGNLQQSTQRLVQDHQTAKNKQGEL